MRMLARSIVGKGFAPPLARGRREGSGTYHVWCRDGRIVADRSNLCQKQKPTQGGVLCESARRKDGAAGTHWGESS